MKKRLLVIAAHPDDEVLGCGGAVARFVKEGGDAHIMILGEGITSRDDRRNTVGRASDVGRLKQQVAKAGSALAIKSILTYDFPDNRFDEVSLLDIIKVIESVNFKVRPDIIYTHHRNDLNIDHRITYNAVLTACRPCDSQAVKEIYSFEIISSSEWNYPHRLNPNYFIDITQTIDQKLSALKNYRSELKQYPHPRSIRGVKLNAAYWGMHVGVKYAEAFEAIRVIK